jgi:hypothetical protein
MTIGNVGSPSGGCSRASSGSLNSEQKDILKKGILETLKKIQNAESDLRKEGIGPDKKFARTISTRHHVGPASTNSSTSQVESEPPRPISKAEKLFLAFIVSKLKPVQGSPVQPLVSDFNSLQDIMLSIWDRGMEERESHNFEMADRYDCIFDSLAFIRDHLQRPLLTISLEQKAMIHRAYESMIKSENQRGKDFIDVLLEGVGELRP